MTTTVQSMQPVIVPSVAFLNTAKVLNPKGCSVEQDKLLKTPVLVMKGEPSQTRVQFPREDRPLSSLHIRDSLLSMQLFLSSVDQFMVELTITQSAVIRMKLIIGTQVHEAKHETPLGSMPVARLPLIIPRSRWVQVVFHVAGIVETLFGLPPMKSIDSIALAGTAKVSRVMSSQDEESCIASTPEGMALFAVPAYTPPIWSTAPKPPSPFKEGLGTGNDTKSPPPKLLSEGGRGSVNGDREAGSALLGSTSSLSTSSPTRRGRAAPARLQPLEQPCVSHLGDARGGSAVMEAAQPSKYGQPPLEQQGASLSTSQSTRPTPSTATSPVVDHRDVQSTTTTTTAKAQKGAARTYLRLVEDGESPQPPRTVLFGLAPRRAPAGPEGAARDAARAGGRGAGPSGDCTRPGEGPLGLWSAPTDTTDAISGWGDAEDGATPTTTSAGPAAKDNASPTHSPPRGADTHASGTHSKQRPSITERQARVVAARKRHVAPPRTRSQQHQGSRSGSSAREGPTVSPAVRRRRRARRRMQLLRANAQKNSKLVAARALLPSELPIAGDPVGSPTEATLSTPTSATADEGGGLRAEPKYGYGFGYLGVLHENGEYVVDENADLNLRGAMSLELSEDE